MMSSVNGVRKYHINEKTGIAEEFLIFYPESYLNNKNHPEYYTPLNPEEIICEFIIKEKLGEGGFGSVRLGINKQTGEKVAIKILEKSKLTRYEDKIRIHREIEILKKVKHPNIVQLYSVIETEKQIFLIMEYIKGQELYQYILLKKKLSEEEACFYFQQIISGIEYLHKLKIAHRDIKSENILIEQNTKTIKIIDFGLSNTYGDKDNEILKTACGSPFYAPPEMLRGDSYRGGTVDIWSCGVVLFAMICGFLPFEGEENSQLYKKIIDGKYSIPTHVSNQARELIYQLLNTNPRKRITISQIKKHAWIKLYMKESIFNEGLNIDKYVIPIDEDIIDDIDKKFHLSKIKTRINILSNQSNDITTLFYLLLNQKKNNGIKSISDLKSDLFLKYIKNKKNLLSNYKNGLQDAINSRKMGMKPLDNKRENNDDQNILDNNLDIKNNDNIHYKKHNSYIQNIQMENIKTPNNKSILNLKLSSDNNSISLNKNQNSNKNNFTNIKKKVISASPLKKTKSKIKFSNFNIKNNKNKHKEKNFKTSLDSNRLICKNNQYYNIDINNNLEINNKKVYIRINPRIQSATLSPNLIKKQKFKITCKTNKINKIFKSKNFSNDNEISVENIINKTEIRTILENKSDIKNKSKEKKNQTIILSKEEKEDEKMKTKINDYKQQKDSNYFANIKKNNNCLENNHNKLPHNNKNIYINVEEKIDTLENSPKNLPTDGDIYEPSPIFKEKNQKETANNLITDEKIKYAQTLDSFSMPTINQEDYLISSNNHTTYQNIQEASFTPKKEIVIKTKINTNKKITNNKVKLLKKSKKGNKIHLYEISKKKSSNFKQYNNIYNNIIKSKIKKISHFNIKSLSRKRNNSTQKKSISCKKIDRSECKRKIMENNKTEILKKFNRNIKNLKTNNNNLNIENTYLLINNISSFNPADGYNKELLGTENNNQNYNIKKAAEKYKNNHKKFNSIEKYEKLYKKIDKHNSITNNNPDENIKRINAIYVNNNKLFKKQEINMNKLSSPTISNNYKKNTKKIKEQYKTYKNQNNYYNKIYLNQNYANSGFLFTRNSKNKNNKILNAYSPLSNTLNKNINFNIGNIDIKPFKSKNDCLNIYKEKIFKNEEKSDIYEPFDLNCIFALPRKKIKEKMACVLENLKCKIKQINPYKYIIYGKKYSYELNISLNNNATTLKFRNIKGSNKYEYINNVQKIIQDIYE